MTDSPTTPRIHLAASIEAEPTDELVKAVADAVGKTAYDIRLRLRTGLPRSLACCESIDAAEVRAAALNQLGIMTIVYDEKDLPAAEPIAATGLDRLKSGLRIKLRKSAFDIPGEEITLFVYGNRRLSRETKEIQKTSFISPSSVIATGIPMALSGSMHVSRRETTGQYFLMLFRRDPLAPPIEIRQDGFDYACLGDKRGLSKQESLQILVAALRKVFPDVPFNDCLLQGQSNNRGEAFYNRRLSPDSSAANATLIYWGLLALQGGRRHFTARR